VVLVRNAPADWTKVGQLERATAIAGN